MTFAPAHSRHEFTFTSASTFLIALFFSAVGCSSAKPVEQVKPPVVAVIASSSVAAPPIPEPTPAERLGAFLQQLSPLGGPETLVLGIETVPSSGYGPLYGDGPRVPPEDKLHTIILHAHDGRVELAGELPYLAIPRDNGFLYMGVAAYERDDTEAERKRQGAKFGMGDEYGSVVYWYAASSLWRTTERSKVDSVRTSERKSLKQRYRRGDMFGEDVNYVTRYALCTNRYRAEWTGGAQAFTGGEDQTFEGLTQGKLPTLLANYTDDAGLRKFVQAIFQQREPGDDHSDISLDETYEMFGYEINWRKDSHVCLARTNGHVSLTGVIRLPNNGSRTSEWETPVFDAPATLATNAAPPVALSDIRKAMAIPKAVDAVVSPKRTMIVARLPDRFVVYGNAAPAPLLTIPISGRIIMAEWAEGDAAKTWSTVGDSPKKTGPEVCTCELGQLCIESKCVKPKKIFVTSTLYSGDLGGLAGADAKCQARALAGGLDGKYAAWLSDSTNSAAARLSHATVPYVLVDGTVVAKNWTELTGGNLRAPIRLTELVDWPPIVPHPEWCSSTIVWTNTRDDGSLPEKNHSCNNWTDGTSTARDLKKTGVWGRANDESRWSMGCETDRVGCDAKLPLYCIEQ